MSSPTPCPTSLLLPLRMLSLRTSSLPLSPVYLPQEITLSYSPSLITSVKLFSSPLWRTFCQSLGALASLTSGFHLQSKSQMKRVNQDLESSLHCVATCLPASWASHLPWMSMLTTLWSVLLLVCRRFCHSVPSVQAHLCCMQRVRWEAQAA